MPRKPPSLEGGVLEHRITFGTFERQQLNPLIEAHTELASAEAIAKTAEAVAYGVGVVGVVGLGYLGYKAAVKYYTGEEPSILNIFSEEGRNNLKQKVKDDPKGSFWSLFLDPLGVNPFW